MTYRIIALHDAPLAAQREAVQGLIEEMIEAPCTLKHDAQGAPILVSHPDMQISISHCKQACAVALSHNKAVGIDVECRRRVNPELLPRVCTAEELAAIAAAADPELAFLQLWTRKEAVLKCMRTGIKGFESLRSALCNKHFISEAIPTGIEGVVAALAWHS